MARYSLFVLKMPLNTNQPTNHRLMGSQLSLSHRIKQKIGKKWTKNKLMSVVSPVQSSDLWRESRGPKSVVLKSYGGKDVLRS